MFAKNGASFKYAWLPQILYKKQLPLYGNNMVMDGYYVQDKLQELWRKIDKLHLSYLQMEEGTDKLVHRAKLEGKLRHLVLFVWLLEW